MKKTDRLNPQPRGDRDGASDAPHRKCPPLSPTRRLNRLLGRCEEVLCFITDLTLPFTNNRSERDLRMVKVQQKVGGCFRAEDGARDFCRVRSYLSTARKQDHRLLYALERVLAGKPLPFTSSPA